MESSLTFKSFKKASSFESSTLLFKSSAETEPITKNNIKTIEKSIAYFLLKIIPPPNSHNRNEKNFNCKKSKEKEIKISYLFHVFKSFFEFGHYTRK